MVNYEIQGFPKIETYRPDAFFSMAAADSVHGDHSQRRPGLRSYTARHRPVPCFTMRQEIPSAAEFKIGTPWERGGVGKDFWSFLKKKDCVPEAGPQPGAGAARPWA